MLSLELNSKIEQYVDSAITLDHLEDWIVPRLRNYLRNQGTADSHAISVIELGLAEISAGIKSENEFRNDLRNITRHPVTVVTFNPPRENTVYGSSNETVKEKTVVLWRTPIQNHG